MPTVQELGLLSNAVYGNPPLVVTGWRLHHFAPASTSLNGFQAAIFQKGPDTVIAFRGTAQAMDGIADLKLGTGMNSTYFSDGDDYAMPHRGSQHVFITGHSLGGAIAQVVANRGGFKFATFNAPGVAVLASRNIANSSSAMNLIRTTGMLVSAIRHPVQAARDVGAAFSIAHGLNVCLENDAVSAVGNHYGEVIRITGTSMNPLTEHRMTTMNTVLTTHAVGQRSVQSF